MSRTREPSVTYFDPNGDTRLLLKQANGSPDKKTFVVSYKTMCLVCDSWDRILNPTGYSRETRHGHTISLPHDDWKALEIILNIAHLQFDLVPRKIDFHLLLEVAVLTEKYGATKIVRPWYRKWMKHNRKLGTEPGHEEWLWITWAFGEDQKFEKLTMKLVLELEKLPDGRFARTSEVVLDPNDPERHFPPESIFETREWIINYLLREVDNELCKYSDAISEVKAESSTAASDFQDQDNEEEEDESEESGRRILYTIKGEDGEDHELTEEYDEEG
ncbi:Nuclear pore protein [Lasiodiplodia theobromae]|uniref:Nuclear pore protein n=1 Tax=Lasiodiplodia theobromae TaxID=45133 RepID=UPI0015C2F26A|nr:Nuclear pore protein [Lasiodiplodia theobromae]KAF4534770.1 Nuclear pore protein [Lasiodiplodia theobromae]